MWNTNNLYPTPFNHNIIKIDIPNVKMFAECRNFILILNKQGELYASEKNKLTQFTKLTSPAIDSLHCGYFYITIVTFDARIYTYKLFPDNQCRSITWLIDEIDD